MMRELVLETRSLSRHFGPTRAVDRVSLAVPQGHILALVGPNGAGKTTFLKLLLGLIAPTEGTATVLGEPCFPPSPVTARRIACVLDTHEPPPGTRIADLLRLKAGAVTGFDSARAADLIDEHRLGLGQLWHALSKGQRRWVLASIALASGAELLAVDEPADGLDPAARRQLYGLIRRQVNEHRTSVILTSHILTDVERAADDVAVIDRGRVLLHDSLEQLRDEIREVELAEPLAPVDLPAHTQLLGQRVVGQSALAWLRRHGGWPSDDPILGELRRRTASLEEVYLALTEHQDP